MSSTPAVKSGRVLNSMPKNLFKHDNQKQLSDYMGDTFSPNRTKNADGSRIGNYTA